MKSISTIRSKWVRFDGAVSYVVKITRIEGEKPPKVTFRIIGYNPLPVKGEFGSSFAILSAWLKDMGFHMDSTTHFYNLTNE